jgi:hypothetical protein
MDINRDEKINLDAEQFMANEAYLVNEIAVEFADVLICPKTGVIPEGIINTLKDELSYDPALAMRSGMTRPELLAVVRNRIEHNLKRDALVIKAAQAKTDRRAVRLSRIFQGAR